MSAIVWSYLTGGLVFLALADVNHEWSDKAPRWLPPLVLGAIYVCWPVVILRILVGMSGFAEKD